MAADHAGPPLTLIESERRSRALQSAQPEMGATI
jgi:hypothetical protein